MVSGSLSYSEGSGTRKGSAPLSTYTEQFYEQFPYYLSIGMTAHQYWEEDPMLCKYYRKAEEMRKERLNQQLWLQGLYVYSAMCDVAPIFQAFAKKGTKAKPYADAPFPLSVKAQKKEKEQKQRAVSSKGKSYMEAMMMQMNKKFAPSSPES